jgi:RNA polymerase sigma factor (TIGR02999 family)
MTDVTQILSRIESGDPTASDELLPLVYDELCKLAAGKLALEKPGQTLQATALVHEAYLRLVGVESTQKWDSRGHFFAAAAEAMRRILVEQARRKDRLKRGGNFVRRNLDGAQLATHVKFDEILAVDEALGKLNSQNSAAAQIVKLRYFAGMSIPESADAMGISPRKANQIWAYARAWLMAEMSESGPA